MAAFVMACIAGAVGGTLALDRYSATPGPAAAAPDRWPDDVPPRADGRPTLVLFAHARCPCTRASLAELEVVLSRTEADVDARVAVYRPRGASPSEWEGDAWKAAGRIASATRQWDEDGTLARRFGAATSGHVVLYDAEGRLLFSGGITASRGHQGDNAGRREVLALLAGAGRSQAGSPVFGCSLDGRPAAEERNPS